MGVIGLGQTQVKRGDRKEFKSLDLKRSVRIRQGSQTHVKRHSNGRHFNGLQVLPSRKLPVASDNSLGKTSYPSVMSNPQCSILGPGTTIGFASEDQGFSFGPSHISQFANTSQSGLPVNCSFPRSIAVGSIDELAATSSWSWFAEDFSGVRSYQDPHEPRSSYTYLEPSFPEMGHSR